MYQIGRFLAIDPVRNPQGTSPEHHPLSSSQGHGVVFLLYCRVLLSPTLPLSQPLLTSSGLIVLILQRPTEADQDLGDVGIDKLLSASVCLLENKTSDGNKTKTKGRKGSEPQTRSASVSRNLVLTFLN